MIGWSVELIEFDIRYEPKGAIKPQCLVNFSTELTPQQDLSARWTIYVNGLSNKSHMEQKSSSKAQATSFWNKFSSSGSRPPTIRSSTRLF